MQDTTMTRPPLHENNVLGWVRGLDGLLRGDATKMTALRRGIIEVSPDGLTLLIIALGALYGGCMGSYALFQPHGASWLQFFAASGKVPLLFVLTVVVTFPSLYVFNALVGSRLSLSSVFRLIIASVAVMLAILASFGPIVAFFSASTTGYGFMLLINVAVFTVAGLLGLKFLLTTLHRLSVAALEVATAEVNTPNAVQADPTLQDNPTTQNAETVQPLTASGPPLPEIPGSPRPPQHPHPSLPAHLGTLHPPLPGGALARVDHRKPGSEVLTVFRIWIIVFGLVGAQMSWVLRPFLGAPGRPYALFSPRESNFFEAVFHQLWHVLGG